MPEVGALALYAGYLDALPTRAHHPDGTFPRAAVAALATAAPLVLPDGDAVPWTGPWWAARALRMGRRSAAAARLAGADREALAWASLLLPVGAMLGARTVAALGGQTLWQGAPGAFRAAVFAGRLEGVPVRARGLLLRVAEGLDEADPLSRRLARPALALVAAMTIEDLAFLAAPVALVPAHPLARRLLARYRGRIARAAP